MQKLLSCQQSAQNAVDLRKVLSTNSTGANTEPCGTPNVMLFVHKILFDFRRVLSCTHTFFKYFWQEWQHGDKFIIHSKISVAIFKKLNIFCCFKAFIKYSFIQWVIKIFRNCRRTLSDYNFIYKYRNIHEVSGSVLLPTN